MPMHDGNRVTPRKGEVLMTKDGITAAVREASVKVYERNGWTSVDDKSSETAAEDPRFGSYDHDDLFSEELNGDADKEN